MPRPRLAVDRRSQALLAAAAATGVAVGLLVAAFERLTDAALLHQVLDAPLWAQAGAPVVGLVLTALALRWLAGGASPATTDEYIRAFHERRGGLALREVPGRLVAGVATIGFGGAMGLEGPSVYGGAAVGDTVQHRLGALFRRDDAKVLLVAGAAAGVAAVFRAPATGVVFALEVPYTDDVAPRALVPTLMASAASYLTFATIVDTRPLFSLHGTGAEFAVADLGGALLLGALAGVLARGFSTLVHRAKALAVSGRLVLRVAAAGAVLAGLAVLTHAVYDATLSLGPGYEAIAWVDDPELTLTAIAALFAVRATATLATLGGGGAGGLFIPLAVQGVLLGRFVSGVVDDTGSTLFPVIGLAAFLGAGYRTPIASVMFVAETTGRAIYVVPALVAAAVSQLLMGGASVSGNQQSARAGHVERRFRLPVSSVLSTDVLSVPPDATVAEFVWVHVVGRRERSVAVAADGRYLGMCLLGEAAALPRDRWDDVTVAEIMRTDLPVGRPTWTLRMAVMAMDEADVDRLAVVDDGGGFVGLVLSEEIVKLDEVLDETGG